MSIQALDRFIGQTVTHIIVKARPDQPRHQLIIVFSDGCCLELWTSEETLHANPLLQDLGVEYALDYMGRDAVVACIPPVSTGWGMIASDASDGGGRSLEEAHLGMQPIEARVARDLIRLGKSGQPSTPPSLRDPEVAWQCLMVGPDPWRALARELVSDEIALLIRGLILYARSAECYMGSVSPVIQLWDEFVQREPQSHQALGAWIAENSTNRYEPWGGQAFFGTTTIDEYERLRGLRRARAEEGRERDQERMEREEKARHLPQAVARGDAMAVEALLKLGVDWRSIVDEVGSLQAKAGGKNPDAVIEVLARHGVP